MLHRFEDPDGRAIWQIWGVASLNIALETIPVGKLCRLVYNGKQRDGRGNDVHSVDVYTVADREDLENEDLTFPN